MINIGFAGAFFGGILTLLSPCSVMLLPAFFSYAFSNPGQLLARTGVFYLGLAATLVPLGVLAGTLGGFVTQHRHALVLGAAAVVIVLGIVQLVGVPIPFANAGPAVGGTSPAAVFLLGTIYGLLGACAGPILGSVLTLAALGGTPLYGGLVLAVFAAGMTFPLVALALLWSRFDGVQRWLRPRELKIGKWRNSWTQIIGGVVSISLGIFLIASGGFTEGGLLTASQQYRLESWTMSSTSGIPDYAFALGAILLVAAVYGAHRLSRARAAAGKDTQAVRNFVSAKK